jgi:hypothetical protein
MRRARRIVRRVRADALPLAAEHLGSGRFFAIELGERPRFR